jgi:4-diphosphocytidyl-2-C-methyl-D-erythritol kinase
MSGSSERLEGVRAPAKINLFLRVLGRRSDGYHDLETVILPIGLADQLHIHAVADPTFRTLSLSLAVEGRPELTRGVPADESNLVLRAAKALADRAGIRGFADITLEKLVPSGAGLGGGSSDAAATLRTLNRLWDCGLGDDDLREVASEVGSDVPPLVGEGPAMARGRGERIEAANVPPLRWLLATFDFEISTRDAFEWWDEDGAVSGPDPTRVVAAAARARDPDDPAGRSALGALLFNDLEGPAVRRHPVIGAALDVLRDGGATTAILSGSGPSVVGLFAESLHGTDRVDRLERDIERMTGRQPIWVTSRGAAAP